MNDYTDSDPTFDQIEAARRRRHFWRTLTFFAGFGLAGVILILSVRGLLP